MYREGGEVYIPIVTGRSHEVGLQEAHARVVFNNVLNLSELPNTHRLVTRYFDKINHSCGMIKTGGRWNQYFMQSSCQLMDDSDLISTGR